MHSMKHLTSLIKLTQSSKLHISCVQQIATNKDKQYCLCQRIAQLTVMSDKQKIRSVTWLFVYGIR